MPQHTPHRFFLTRQSANILQDLARRCESPAAISVLYGLGGVGKSCLLSHFAQKYAQGQKCFHLCFDERDGFHAFGKPASTQPQSQLESALLQRLPKGSILLLDQFERMSASASQALFDFWQRHAAEKNLKLVLAMPRDHLASFQRLLEGSPLAAQSVELKPLDSAEQLEFVRASCCAEAASPVLSRDLRKQLAASGGYFSALQAFIDQHCSQLDCVAGKAVRSQVWIWRYLLSLLLLAVGAWLFFQYRAVSVENTAALPQATPTVPAVQSISRAQKQQPLAASTVEMPSAGSSVESQVDSKAQDGEGEAAAPRNLAKPALAQAEPASKKVIAEAKVTPPMASRRVDAAAPAATLAPAEKSIADPFEKSLAATRQWLSRSDAAASSIQIMALRANRNTRRSLRTYLKKLEKAGVDIEKVKIFTFNRSGQAMYGVLYGSYRNSDQARAGIRNLPAGLKADRPMVRTVKGIRQDQRAKQN